MIEDIKSKVCAVLVKDCLLEADVVYFLVEIGKVLELYKIKSDFQIVWFYRNWVVHSKIDKSSPFGRVLRDWFKGLPDRSEILATAVFPFVSFIALERELNVFSRQVLKRSEPIDQKFFEMFDRELLKVLSDVPIHLEYDADRVIISLNGAGGLDIIGPGNFRGEMSIQRASSNNG